MILCRIAGIARKNYYSFLKNPKKFDEEEYIALITGLQTEHNYSLGYRQMTTLIFKTTGIRINAKKVLSLMRGNNLLSAVRRRKYSPEVYLRMSQIKTFIPKDLIKRNFWACRPNQKYLTDITYLYCQEGMFYLCMIEDLFNREIVAWKISGSIDEKLCLDTLNMLAGLRDLKGSVIHSDQGSSYLSVNYKARIMELGAMQSCSARGICWDNAAMESANGIFKTEGMYARFGKSAFKNHRIPAATVISQAEYFINFYNTERPKESLGWLSPVEFRLQNANGTELMVLDNSVRTK